MFFGTSVFCIKCCLKDWVTQWHDQPSQIKRTEKSVVDEPAVPWAQQKRPQGPTQSGLSKPRSPGAKMAGIYGCPSTRKNIVRRGFDSSPYEYVRFHFLGLSQIDSNCVLQTPAGFIIRCHKSIPIEVLTNSVIRWYTSFLVKPRCAMIKWYLHIPILAQPA